MGGRSEPAVPPAEARRTRRAETKRRTPAQPELRHAAAGLEGSDAHPAFQVPEATPPRPRGDRSHQRAALPSFNEAPTKQRSRSRPAVAAACARTCAPAAAAPSGRIERATRRRKHATSGGFTRSASARSFDPRVPFARHPPARVRRSSSERTETPQSDSAPRKRGRARSRRGRETLWDVTLPMPDPAFLPPRDRSAS